MLEGSCLCGAIAYRAANPTNTYVYCHCDYCRKNSGSAFSSNVRVMRDGFQIVRGSDKLRAYESSPGKRRCFCSVCGSPLFNVVEGEDSIIVKLGSVDRFDGWDEDVRSRHLFRDSALKAPWIRYE